jgi:hypothetical protein
LGLIFLGIGIGFLLQKVDERKIIEFPIPKSVLRKGLQKIALLFFMPVSFLAAIWRINFGDSGILTMPLIGVFAIILGLLLSFLAANFLKLPRSEKGPFITCGSFANIGSIGGFICYIFLGEKGFALVPFYNFILPTLYFALGFPIVKYYSQKTSPSESIIKRFLKGITDIFVLAALVGIFGGMTLNIVGIARPSLFQYVTAVFVPLGTVLMLISIGLEIRFSKVKDYLRECIIISVIKFIIIPTSMVLIALQFGYGQIAGGLPLKVIMILTSMPVAFIALVPVSLYDLDLILANSCWLFTTTALILVIPTLYFLVNLV